MGGFRHFDNGMSFGTYLISIYPFSRGIGKGCQKRVFLALAGKAGKGGKKVQIFLTG
jgi:hypothetical protein